MFKKNYSRSNHQDPISQVETNLTAVLNKPSTTTPINASTSEVIRIPHQTTPSDILSIPYAAPKKAIRQGRKPKTSAILTDTPEKLLIEEKEKAKAQKIRSSYQRKKDLTKKKMMYCH